MTQPLDQEREFDAGEGAFHVFKHAARRGWSGLLLLLAVYIVGSLLLYGLLMWSLAPLFNVLPSWIETEPGPAAVRAVLTPFFVAGPLFLLLYWAFYCIIDAALLRWFYGRGVKFRFGGVELRLMLICLLIYVLIALAWIPTWVLIAVGVGTGNLAVILIGGLSVFLALALMIFLAVKFAPAAALTVYRSHFSFFRAWNASRGVFWGLLGAFVIVWVIYLAASFALNMLFQPFMMMAMGENAELLTAAQTGQMEPEQAAALVQAMFSADMFWIIAASSVLSFFVYFFFQAALAGTNAYAVKFRFEDAAPEEGALDVPPPSGGGRVEAAAPEHADPVTDAPGPAGPPASDNASDREVKS